MIFDLRRGIGLVAHLVLEPHDLHRIALAIRRPARHQETGKPAFGIGQRQECVAHRRRAEPFVAGQRVGAVGVLRGARRVGAHVGAALFLRHRHADGDAGLFGLAGREAGSYLPARMRGSHSFATSGSMAQRRQRGIGHRHRAADAGLGLRHQEFDGRMQHMAGLGPAPRRRGDARFEAQRHEFMIGGMEFHLVDALAVAIEGFELRRVPVGLHRPVRDFGRARARAEFGEALRVHRAARMTQRVLQRCIGREQIDVFEGRRLVRDLMGLEIGAGLECGHGRPPGRRQSHYRRGRRYADGVFLLGSRQRKRPTRPE